VAAAPSGRVRDDPPTLQFNPEWVVDRIAPRPALFITTDNDRLVPPEESVQLYARAGEPKKLVVLKGYGHYEVYIEPAFSARPCRPLWPGAGSTCPRGMGQHAPQPGWRSRGVSGSC
jgi:fermentation-respiration switch protein FrsA (DUF1100 family)